MATYNGCNWIRRSTRCAVYARDGFRCVYCGKRHAVGKLTLDHVIPRAAGGSNAPSNLVTACARCNTEKGDATLADYAAAAWGPWADETMDRVRAALDEDITAYRAQGRALARLHYPGSC